MIDFTKKTARTEPESHLGNLAKTIIAIREEEFQSLSFDSCRSWPLRIWKETARELVEKSLCYNPTPVPLGIKIEATEKRDQYELKKITFATASHTRVPAFLLIPSQGKPPYPGIVALHDHGEFHYFGKEKIVSCPQEHKILKSFREQYYGSRPYAEEFARRGYVVLVIDAFYWGERRLQFKAIPSELEEKLSGISPSSEQYIIIWNDFYNDRVKSLNTMLGFCGTTWLGIEVHDDRKSIDVLQSIPEVDPERIGAIGLSGGGYRTGYLAGMDDRIKVAVIVGWMTELVDLVRISEPVHYGRPIAEEGVYKHLDHPDIVSLAAPECALNIFNCGQDHLYTFASMKRACEKIGAVYEKIGASSKFNYKFFDVPHQFNIEMQEEAFNWLDHWLKDS